jgi:hypothetical protein
MENAAKKKLYDLIDQLPDSEVAAARQYLEFLRSRASDPYSRLDAEDPFGNMPEEERERLHASLERSESDFAQGKGIAAETVLRELRTR